MIQKVHKCLRTYFFSIMLKFCGNKPRTNRFRAKKPKFILAVLFVESAYILLKKIELVFIKFYIIDKDTILNHICTNIIPFMCFYGCTVGQNGIKRVCTL